MGPRAIRKLTAAAPPLRPRDGAAVAGLLAAPPDAAPLLAASALCPARNPDNNTPENHQFMRVYAAVWIAFLVLLMALLFIAGYDIWATRRFSVREQRKILDARREMLQHEVGRLRRERNGHG